jgi:hypothetical protein
VYHIEKEGNAMPWSLFCAAVIFSVGSPLYAQTGVPGPLYGVTVETINSNARASTLTHLRMNSARPWDFVAPRNLGSLTESLAKLPHKPTTRVVFQEGLPASHYADAVSRIHKVSYVMGEILDSSAFSQAGVREYLARTSEYMNALGANVAIWEIGNEINGEWLGKTPEVAAKMTGAYDLMKASGKTTALTLYLNQGCFEDPDHEVFAWAQANIPERMKRGLDYVLISYYEDDCNGLRPDWPVVFHRLAVMFPNSKLGIGECGTTHEAQKAEYIARYYGMKVGVPNYVGGYFWWYYAQDMVPYTKPLWGVLSNAMGGGPLP